MNRANDAAFPIPHFQREGGDIDWGQGGLTVREHFAGLAMSAWVHQFAPRPETYAVIAKVSVDLADALIAELAKAKP